MEIRTLRYVVTLAEELHFGRAARRHFIAAQPFGQHVQRLERELGVRLFQRTSRRVTMTAEGERFVVEARAVLARLDGLRAVAADDRPPDDRPLRVGVLGFGAAGRWTDLLQAVRVQAPDLVLEHHELDFDEQYDALRRGQVDVAVVQYVGGLDGLHLVPVLSSPRVAVVPAASALADAVRLRPEELEGRRWLTVACREPALRSWLGPAADASAPALRHPAAIPAAVATTGRVAVHAAAAAEYYPRPDVRFVPVEGPPVQVAVATRADDRGPGVAAFRRAAAAIGEA